MPQPFGLALDSETHDLYLDGSNNLVVARDAHAIGEHVKQRMKMFAGEWFLDTRVGLPWLPRPGQFAIFDRPYNAGASEALIKAEILNTPGVVAVEDFEARVDRATRGLIVEAEIVTIFDNVRITSEVTV
jgi:hypothetical protein